MLPEIEPKQLHRNVRCEAQRDGPTIYVRCLELLDRPHGRRERGRRIGQHLQRRTLRHLHHATENPPLTRRVWPVTKAAASEARYATADATSSGLAKRRRGVWRATTICVFS